MRRCFAASGFISSAVQTQPASLPHLYDMLPCRGTALTRLPTEKVATQQATYGRRSTALPILQI